MTTFIASKPCQANDNGTTCTKDARAKCFHCSRDLCLLHLTAHAQLVESQTQTFLRSHQTTLADLSHRLARLSISSRVSELPFVQLEEWRRAAHDKVDQLAERKRQEILIKLSEYQTILTGKANEEGRTVETLKQYLGDLARKRHLSAKEMRYFENKVNETQQFLSGVERHSIKLSTSDFVVTLRANLFDSQPLQSTRIARAETRHRLDKKRSRSACVL